MHTVTLLKVIHTHLATFITTFRDRTFKTTEGMQKKKGLQLGMCWLVSLLAGDQTEIQGLAQGHDDSMSWGSNHLAYNQWMTTQPPGPQQPFILIIVILLYMHYIFIEYLLVFLQNPE